MSNQRVSPIPFFKKHTYRHDQTCRIIYIHLQVTCHQSDVFRPKLQTKISKLLIGECFDRGSINTPRSSLLRESYSILGDCSGGERRLDWATNPERGQTATPGSYRQSCRRRYVQPQRPTLIVPALQSPVAENHPA